MKKEKEDKKQDTGKTGNIKERWGRLPQKGRRAIRIGGIVFLAAAVAVIAYAVYMMVDAETQASDSLAQIKDRIAEPTPTENTAAAVDSASLETADPAPTRTADPVPTPTPAFEVDDQPAGEAFGYMIFDTILDDGEKREVALIEGTTPEDLDNGAGHYVGFSYPGEDGNTPVFGHRTTVFKDFDKLQVGDRITIMTDYGKYVYQIVDMQVTEPMAPIMFRVYEEPMLTLVTCYPFIYAGHAPDRYVVVSELIEREDATTE